jgi:hypothetical protein
MLSVELSDPWVGDSDLYKLFEQCLHNLSRDEVEYHSVRDNRAVVTIFARCEPSMNTVVLVELAETIELLAETGQLRSDSDIDGSPADARPSQGRPQMKASSAGIIKTPPVHRGRRPR